MIPITTVQFGAEEEALVLEVLRSGQIAQGPMVAQLESEFAAHARRRRTPIAVNNGTTALVAALQVARSAAGRRGHHERRSPSSPR